MDEWELYDRKSDPLEMKNVYDDTSYAQIKDDLHDQLDLLRDKYQDSLALDKKFIEIYEERENR